MLQELDFGTYLQGMFSEPSLYVRVNPDAAAMSGCKPVRRLAGGDFIVSRPEWTAKTRGVKPRFGGNPVENKLAWMALVAMPVRHDQSEAAFIEGTRHLY